MSQPALGSSSLGAALAEATKSKFNSRGTPAAQPARSLNSPIMLGVDKSKPSGSSSSTSTAVAEPEVAAPRRRATCSRTRRMAPQADQTTTESTEKEIDSRTRYQKVCDFLDAKFPRACIWLGDVRKQVVEFFTTPSPRLAIFGAVVLLLVIFWFMHHGTSTSPEADTIKPGTVTTADGTAAGVTTQFHRFAIVRVASRGFMSSFSSGSNTPRYIVDDVGSAHVIPASAVSALEKWRDGDAVSLPETYPAWLPATVDNMTGEKWKNLVDLEAPGMTPDKKNDLLSTHVFVSSPATSNTSFALAK